MTARLVSIIGPPAVGKTTLAECLGRDLPAEIIYEDYNGNPFLAASYTGPDIARLPSQLYFLISRVGQLSLANWPEGGTIVSDYGFCQDRIFAEARLSAEELKLYEKIARRMNGLIKPPDLLICLDAPTAVLLDRIARRGRDHETAMDAAFISDMRKAYNDISDHAGGKVLSVDCDSTDIRDPAVMAPLLAEIRRRIGV